MYEELAAALHQLARELEAAASVVEGLLPQVSLARIEVDPTETGPTADGFERLELARHRLLAALEGEPRPGAERWCSR